MTKYIIMVLGGAISFGILSSFVKVAYGQGYNAAELSFIQALLGAIVLWAVYACSNKSNATRKDIFLLLISGSCIGVSTYLYYSSVKYIPASISIVLLMQFTWLSIIMEWVLFKRKPLLLELIITVIILAGTVLASGLTDLANFELSLKGVCIVLLASLIYAAYIVSNSRTGKDVAWQNKSAWIMTGSAISILLVNFGSIVSSIQLDVGLFQWGIFLAFFGAVLPPVLFAIGMPKVGASTSSILMTVELPVAVVTAYLILKEHITTMQFSGIFLMGAAIIAMNIIKQRSPRQMAKEA
jgi:drug/metabolite transporter (DMT)-like permease